MVEYDEEYVKGLLSDLDAFKYGLAAICVVCFLLSAVLAFSLYTVTSREAKIYKKLQDLEKNGSEDGKHDTIIGTYVYI